jgi:hypothetical protein
MDKILFQNPAGLDKRRISIKIAMMVCKNLAAQRIPRQTMRPSRHYYHLLLGWKLFSMRALSFSICLKALSSSLSRPFSFLRKREPLIFIPQTYKINFSRPFINDT